METSLSTSKTRFSAKKRLIIRAALIILASLLLTFFLESRFFLNDPARAWQFVTERPLVFLYNALLMSFIALFFSALIKRPFLGLGTTWILVTIITYIHINKFNFRGTPLLPEDFNMTSQVGTLTKFIDLWSIVRLLIAITLIIALSLLLDHLTKNYLQIKRHHFLPRATLAALAISGLILGTGFARHHTGEKYEKIPWLASEFIAWNQTVNYEDNGFILGFAYNMGKYELSPPDNYSEAEIAKIAAEYNSKKDESRTALKDADYNIVIVLNESFYDPELIREYYNYTGGDVTPNLHRIMSETPSGRMFSPDYGGGTANIEFEVFTGLTNYWANAVPYTDLLPRAETVPSIATFAKANGYQTTVIHPFNGGMYRRNLILPKEGFDEFITESEMHHVEHDENSQYINDRSSYQEALELLNTRSQRQLIGLITMQNHAPYDHDIYAQHDFTVTSGYGNDDGRRLDIETYLQMLHSSDAYLGEFISALDKSKEKTVVLFFGDHSAGLFPEIAESEDPAIVNIAHLTPYFIYTNFDLETDKSAGAMRLVTTTPNCLTNTMFNLLNVEKPTLNYLLDQVCAETPILSPVYIRNNDPEKTPALTSYEMVNYDLLDGEYYWLKH